MELNIKNFSKIKEASIKIEGITVIAGENNTGKSTIGKILFSCFYSPKTLNDEIYMSKLYSISNEVNLLIQSLSVNNDSIKKILPMIGLGAAVSPALIGNLAAASLPIALTPLLLAGSTMFSIMNKKHKKNNNFDINHLVENIIYDLMNETESKKVYNILIDNFSKYIDIQDEKNINIIKKHSKKIENIVNISNERIGYEKITEYYKNIFNNQINSRIDKDTEAEINIDELVFKFKNDKCIKSNLSIVSNQSAYFIDNPFVLDKKNDINYLSIPEYYLINNILCNEGASVTDKILAEEKLEEIYNKLSYAVNGKIIKKDDDFYLEEDGFAEPISIHNLSAGLKSFTIIKMLLEKNALKEDDILILDEPEIHLHPKWQLLYAETIVLLQKIFNIYIIITTHSPYFLEAIEMYSKKHCIEENANYYLSDIENNHSVFKLVNENIEEIYSKMVQPINDLEDLSNMFE